MREIRPNMKVADLTVEEFAMVMHDVVEEALVEMLAGIAGNLPGEEGELSEEFLNQLEADIRAGMDDGPPTDEVTQRRRKRK